MKSDMQTASPADSKPLTMPHSPGVTILTPMRIASMSERELQEALPQLVAVLQQGFVSKRPDWWPHSTIPWTLNNIPASVKSASPIAVRNLVSKCYNFLSQHRVKPVGPVSAQPKVPSQPRVIDWLNSHPTNRTCTQQAKGSEHSSPQQKGTVPYLEIYLCYQCDEEFSTKETLQKHQLQCSGGPLPLSIPSTPPASEAPSPLQPTVQSDETSSSCGGPPSLLSTLPPTPPEVSHGDFVAGLDLVPVNKARKIRLARRRNTECETIDLEEPQTPISPSTPRTPKLLISQLSREPSSSGGTGGSGGHQGWASRRRLSYLRQSMEKRADKGPEDGEGGAESDGDSNESSADDADEPKLHKKSLFNIDVTSVLGQRVLRHMTAETSVPVIADSEQFCRTPIKDKYQDRLRIRQASYPITWKLTRKRLRQQTHCHLYKLTRAHKRDFMELMRTGLNAGCRGLLDCLRGCSVVVKRLSSKTLYRWKPSLNMDKLSVPLTPLTPREIEFWTTPKPSSPQPCVFPDGPTFLSAGMDRVLGLKRKGVSPEVSRALLAPHCVSETANAELQLQKLTVYRSLLADLSSSGHGPTQGGPGGSKNYPTLYSILSGSPPFKAPAQGQDVKKPLKIEIPSSTPSHSPGRHRAIEKSSPLDDSFSIMTVSSDEDVSKTAACCSLCATRAKCRCPSPNKPSSSSRSLPSTSRSLPSTSLPSLSSRSGGSATPPKLASPSLTPRTCLSSMPTLSPPNLSPISQGSEPRSRSPSSTSPRVSTRRSATLSPAKTSPPHPRSKSLLSQSPLAAQRRRSVSPCARSPGKVSGADAGQRSDVSPLSRDLLQPLLTVQRPKLRSGPKESLINTRSGSKDSTTKPRSSSKESSTNTRSSSKESVNTNTRSSSKESATSEPHAASGLRKSSSAPSNTGSRSRKELPGVMKVAPGSKFSSSTTEGKSVSSGEQARSTRSSALPSERHSGAVQDAAASGGMGFRSRHGKRAHTGQSTSNSGSINQNSDERKSSGGQNLWSNSTSHDRHRKEGKVRNEMCETEKEANSVDSNQNSVRKGPRGNDRVARTLRSGQSAGSAQSQSDRDSSWDSVDRKKTKDSHCETVNETVNAHTRRSSRVNDVECSSVTARGLRRGATSEAASFNNRAETATVDNSQAASQGQRRVVIAESRIEAGDGKKGTESEGVADDDSGTKDSSSSSSHNPFLASKAQTQLFSSSVMEQARRHWHPSPRSPTQERSGAKGTLRSGTTFRISNMGLGSGSVGLGSGSTGLGSGSAGLGTGLGSGPSSLGSGSAGPGCELGLGGASFSSSAACPPPSTQQSKDTSKSRPGPLVLSLPPVSPTPLTSPPGALSPRGQVRNRLSPLQMLSVLESAKGRSKVKSTSGLSSPKTSSHQRRLDKAFTRITGQKPGYSTRASQSSSPAKKARFAD